MSPVLLAEILGILLNKVTAEGKGDLVHYQTNKMYEHYNLNLIH